MAEPTQKEPGEVEGGASRGATDASGGAAPPGAAVEERRGALRALIAVGGLAYAGALAVPAARFVLPEGGDKAAGERWIRVGRLDDLPPNEPRRLQIIGDERDAFTVAKDQMLGSVWVLREAGDKVRAMSATCPHLGCAIDLNADKKSFACPCHASKFSLAGAIEAGPSPRGMDALATRVADGWVEVDFRRYRQGTEDKEEVSA